MSDAKRWKAFGTIVREVDDRNEDGAGALVVECGKPHAENEAKAHLIAAAPELLAACEAALAYDAAIQTHAREGRVDLRMDGAGIATGDDLDAAYDAWLCAARNAIAAARGAT